MLEIGVTARAQREVIPCNHDAIMMHSGCTQDALRMHSGCTQDALKMHSASRSAYRSAQRRLSASGEYAHGPLRIHEERADVTPSKGALLAEAASRDRALVPKAPWWAPMPGAPW